MRPTSSLLGASRLPLTTKRGNKDFYKGTRQAYVPGGGHRTGPPGKHVVRGKAKYRLVDEQVRFYVGPGQEALRNTSVCVFGRAAIPSEPVSLGRCIALTTQLKPYVQTAAERPEKLDVPSFSPNAVASSSSSSPSNAADPDAAASKTISRRDYTRFSREYQRLPIVERQARIFAARREWWHGMAAAFPQKDGGNADASEEAKTAEVEKMASA